MKVRANIKLPVSILAVLLAFCFMGLSANAQVSFSVSDTLVTINKTTITPAAYGYSSIYNDTEQPMPMRWIRRFDTEFPEEWIIYFQDPDTWHNPFDDVDSADFNLSVDTLFTNILNFQVYSNGYTGAGNISFLVFPVDDRSDTVRVTFRTIITQAPLGLHEDPAFAKTTIYPQPSRGPICLKDSDASRIEVYTPEGRYIMKATGSDGCFDLTGLSPSVYMIHIYNARGHKSYARIVIVP